MAYPQTTESWRRRRSWLGRRRILDQGLVRPDAAPRHRDQEDAVRGEREPEDEDAVPREGARLEEVGQHVGDEGERHEKVEEREPAWKHGVVTVQDRDADGDV